MTTDEYLRRVDWELRDLPWGMRKKLLADLRAHLSELPDGTDLAELGSPPQYAVDLRAAAGLDRRRGAIAFLRACRPRDVVLTILALTLIGLAIGAVAWIDSYQPIGFAGSTQWPNAATGDVGISKNESVVFHKGRPFRYGITIRNTGRFAVRVLGVPYGSYLPFTARLLMSGPDPSDSIFPPFMRFRPFDLEPGEIRVLLLEGVYACHSGFGAGPSLTLVDFPVRFSFLWRTTTAEIPLDGLLTFVFPEGCASATP